MQVFCPIKGELGKDFRLTQGFGENPQIYKQFGLAGHNGLDYAGKKAGDKIPCFACFSGTVTRVGFDPNGFGSYVRIVSADGSMEATYGHLDSIQAKAHQVINENSQIGIIGNTGFSTGVHLHFQIRLLYKGGVQNYDNGYKGAIDPTPLISYWSDIEPPASDEDREAIKWAKKSGIFNGERLNEPATRKEVAIMLYRLYNLPK